MKTKLTVEEKLSIIEAKLYQMQTLIELLLNIFDIQYTPSIDIPKHIKRANEKYIDRIREVYEVFK